VLGVSAGGDVENRSARWEVERWWRACRDSELEMGGRAVLASGMSRRGARDGWPSADGEQHVEMRSARWMEAMVEAEGG